MTNNPLKDSDSYNTQTYINWSSGKDSSMALHAIQQQGQLQVDRLLTSVNKTYARVSMHGLRQDLLQAQANAIGLPLDIIEFDEHTDMQSYNQTMQEKVEELVQAGYQHTIFGDIFLEDLRQYREDMLKPYNVNVHFPLWKKDTTQLIDEFIEQGFKAIIVCCNDQWLDKSFAGRLIDKDFLQALPDNVDPCGENGEFHTFCFDGPIFKNPVKFTIGDIVHRSYPAPKTQENPNPKDYGFWYCDLIEVHE